MGGESSKHLSSSSALRSRERKRSGTSNALVGGDCRSSSSLNKRGGTRAGPSYGDVPDHIPVTPVLCTPSPIAPKSALDPALTWIPETEVALVTAWNRERQETAAAGLRGLRAKSSADNGTGSNPPSPLGTKQSTTTTHHNDSATAGVTASSHSVSSSPTASATGGVPLSCDAAPANTGRSTGLVFQVPTTWTHPAPRAGTTGAAAAASAPASSSSSAPSSPKAPAERRGSNKRQSSDSPAPPVVISALPVGIDYYRALQARWLTPESRSMPPPADEDDLNDSTILEAVADPDGDVLSPPVPLGYMIDLFVPQWRAEGLFEQAEMGTHVR